MNLNALGTISMGILSSFSLFNLHSFFSLGILQKTLILSTVGITILVLWGENYF